MTVKTTNQDMRARPIVSCVEETADGWQERKRYALRDFLRMRAAKPLRPLYDHWTRTGRRTPDLEFLRVWKPEIAEAVAAIVDVDEIPDPLDYRIVWHRSRPIGCDGEWEGKALREFEAGDHFIYCAIEYLDCRVTGAPQCHIIEHSVGGVHRFYARIVLPCFDSFGEVFRLCVGSTTFEPSTGGSGLYG